MMRPRLDTHLLLWALAEPHRLDAATQGAIEDPANDVLFSAASLWEIAIKSALGRQDFAFEPEKILRAATTTGFSELCVRSTAAVQAALLPRHHRDPFDRLLVAQAIDEPAHLYTADPMLPPYSKLVTLVGRGIGGQG